MSGFITIRQLASLQTSFGGVQISPKALDDLRLTLGKSQIAAKARSLILWTERGAARVVTP